MGYDNNHSTCLRVIMSDVDCLSPRDDNDVAGLQFYFELVNADRNTVSAQLLGKSHEGLLAGLRRQ